ncbi:patatin-like phospholipase family protein, partial [bacterium]|nr:patatin-like phospholipase family protein [bacterium]
MVSQDETLDERKECDLVMKGGITSGVIYPKLVATLSSIYNFRNIGGTSAGAIAAAAAAAAQLGVKAGSNSNAFRDLEQLPELLGGPASSGSGSMLLNLFQPQHPLRRHFKVLVKMLNAPTKSNLVMRFCMAVVSGFPIGAFLGAIPGVILLAQSWAFGLVVSFVVLVVGIICGAVADALRSFFRQLPGNYFGMCNGMPAEKEKGPDALTTWLDQYINRLAGKNSGEPLTFGELWAGVIRAKGQTLPEVNPENRAIQLSMMTTAVNLGRPYRLPFEPNDIYFVHEELTQFFPQSVIDWMVSHARRPSATADKLTTNGQTFHALPPPEDFPIIVAVRLSLSFPILLSALPLYTVDRTLDVNKEQPTHATRVYFSDGGICSNFPM